MRGTAKYFINSYGRLEKASRSEARYSILIKRDGSEGVENRGKKVLFYIFSQTDELYQNIQIIYDFEKKEVKLNCLERTSIFDNSLIALMRFGFHLFSKESATVSLHDIFRDLNKEDALTARRALEKRYISEFNMPEVFTRDEVLKNIKERWVKGEDPTKLMNILEKLFDVPVFWNEEEIKANQDVWKLNELISRSRCFNEYNGEAFRSAGHGYSVESQERRIKDDTWSERILVISRVLEKKMPGSNIGGPKYKFYYKYVESDFIDHPEEFDLDDICISPDNLFKVERIDD